jgi:hypothetical protein
VRAIAEESAVESADLRFMARLFCQTSLPHTDPGGSSFERSNGRVHLAIVAPARVGLPYGRLPRLLLCWITSEAVRTRRPDLELGESLSRFMRQLDLVPTGGRWGTITRLRQQMERLFLSSISVCINAEGSTYISQVGIASEASLWWNPLNPDQAGLWGSVVRLTAEFFQQLVERPVPVDLRALRALRSPLAIDTYCWLTWRTCYLLHPVRIKWSTLAAQFGSSYKEVRFFKVNFLRAARDVIRLYPDVRMVVETDSLVIHPGATHVIRRTA